MSRFKFFLQKYFHPLPAQEVPNARSKVCEKDEITKCNILCILACFSLLLFLYQPYLISKYIRLRVYLQHIFLTHFHFIFSLC
jgi:hypothetical protein